MLWLEYETFTMGSYVEHLVPAAGASLDSGRNFRNFGLAGGSRSLGMLLKAISGPGSLSYSASGPP
jgi:hypothetical protein